MLSRLRLRQAYLDSPCSSHILYPRFCRLTTIPMICDAGDSKVSSTQLHSIMLLRYRIMADRVPQWLNDRQSFQSP